MTRNRLIAIIAGAAVLVLAIVGIVTFSVASANNQATKDNGTSGVASGGKTSTPAPTSTPSTSASGAPAASGGDSGAGPADPNDPSLGITVVETPDAGSPGDGSASVPDNPAGDRAALDFVNTWISADSTVSDFDKQKAAKLAQMTPSGSPYRTTFSKASTACQGLVGLTFKIGNLSQATPSTTRIAANGNYVYTVMGNLNVRYGSQGTRVEDHFFYNSMWTVELPPPGQPQLVQKVDERINGYNLDNGC